MNNIVNVFEKYKITKPNKKSTIFWRSSDSSANSYLFYKLNEHGPEELDKLKSRLSESSFKLCIVNSLESTNIDNVVSVSDDDFYKLQEEILNYLYPIDFLNKKFCAGITGTNGKTTTTYLISQLAMQAGYRVLSIGTLGILLDNKEIANYNLTTPAYIDLRKEIYKNKDDFDLFVMELSSHALVQKRVGSIKFDSIGWTSFSQDHLDYHGTMEEYFKAKLLVYKQLKDLNQPIVIPDKQTELIEKLNGYNTKIAKTNIETHNPFFKVDYNLENLAVALEVMNSYKNIKYNLEELEPSPGRFNIIDYKNSYIIVDFAHTPDGLKTICRDIKKSFRGYNLITVFGCGGDRDRSKRPLMAKAACENSNYVILTSDNPRFEDPNQIVEDASKGLDSASVIEVDRKAAIRLGFSKLKGAKSILLIAGKGHEPYLDIQGVKYPYNDIEYVRELIND